MYHLAPVSPTTEKIDEFNGYLQNILYRSTSNSRLLGMIMLYCLTKPGLGFRAYDYGPRQNIKRYNNKTPPSYDLKQVKVPIHIISSSNDYFADVKVSLIS